jgi:hypothetical protein
LSSLEVDTETLSIEVDFSGPRYFLEAGESGSDSCSVALERFCESY